MKARILETQVTVYSGASLNSQPLTQVFPGQEVELGAVKKADGKSWVKVTTQYGQEGYVEGTAKVYIIKLVSLGQGSVKVYGSPNLTAMPRMELRKNDKFYLVEVMNQDGKQWVKIRDMQGAEGFIEGSTKINQIPVKSRAAAKKNMTTGAVWFVIGSVVTLGTMMLASGGGTYVVAWGAIIFGAIQFLQGLYQYFTANA